MSAGYSGTPLIKKLGIKENMSVLFVDPPDHYFELLGTLPTLFSIDSETEKSIDFIHLFSTDKSSFLSQYSSLKSQLKFEGMFWVSWPKKSSKLASDVNENLIRNHALANGLVDVKVCAIDLNWSGLKLMYRKKDRG